MEDDHMDDDEGEDAVAIEMRGPDEPTNIPFQARCKKCL